jgi:hypothetical protein
MTSGKPLRIAIPHSPVDELVQPITRPCQHDHTVDIACPADTEV